MENEPKPASCTLSPFFLSSVGMLVVMTLSALSDCSKLIPAAAAMAAARRRVPSLSSPGAFAHGESLVVLLSVGVLVAAAASVVATRVAVLALAVATAACLAAFSRMLPSLRSAAGHSATPRRPSCSASARSPQSASILGYVRASSEGSRPSSLAASAARRRSASTLRNASMSAAVDTSAVTMIMSRSVAPSTSSSEGRMMSNSTSSDSPRCRRRTSMPSARAARRS
mmetsp:Transcript_56728/g.139487  ORF Transcript_56728/g.139487 Transcript_56728/m.139487 type:complete len:227 (-) Transcript_56728:241-921(-)